VAGRGGFIWKPAAALTDLVPRIHQPLFLIWSIDGGVETMNPAYFRLAQGPKAIWGVPGLLLALHRDEFYDVAAGDLTLLQEVVRALAKRLRTLVAERPEEARVEGEGIEKPEALVEAEAAPAAPAAAPEGSPVASPGATLAAAAAGQAPVPGETPSATPEAPVGSSEGASPGPIPSVAPPEPK
jgi:hypothetical protein